MLSNILNNTNCSDTIPVDCMRKFNVEVDLLAVVVVVVAG